MMAIGEEILVSNLSSRDCCKVIFVLEWISDKEKIVKFNFRTACINSGRKILHMLFWLRTPNSWEKEII